MSEILRDHMALLADDQSLQPDATEVVGFIREELYRRKTAAETDIQVIDEALSHRPRLVDTLLGEKIVEKFLYLSGFQIQGLRGELRFEQPFDLWLIENTEDGGVRTWTECHHGLLRELFDTQETSNILRANNALRRYLDTPRKFVELINAKVVSDVIFLSKGSGLQVIALHVDSPLKFFDYAYRTAKNFGSKSIASTLAMADLQKIT